MSVVKQRTVHNPRATSKGRMETRCSARALRVLNRIPTRASLSLSLFVLLPSLAFHSEKKTPPKKKKKNRFGSRARRAHGCAQGG